MNRFSKSLEKSFCVALVVVPLVVSASVRAQTSFSATAESSGDESFMSEGGLKVTIISGSAIAGVAALSAVRTQSAIAAARTAVHGHAVSPRTAPELAQPKGAQSLGSVVLRGTSPGDVIRLEYIAGTEAAMEQAVQDLESSKAVWEKRTAELSRRHRSVDAEASAMRRLYSELPLNDQSKAIRYETLNKLTDLESELKMVKRTLADADARMHIARGQHAAAFKNLGVTHQNHQVNQHYHIIQDVLVDGSPNQVDTVLSRVVGGTPLGARSKAAIPHMRITRIQVPNSAIVKRSLRNVKAGLWGVGISVALILEEVTVGELSKSLAAKTSDHYSPETRTEPMDLGLPASPNQLLE